MLIRRVDKVPVGGCVVDVDADDVDNGTAPGGVGTGRLHHASATTLLSPVRDKLRPIIPNYAVYLLSVLFHETHIWFLHGRCLGTPICRFSSNELPGLNNDTEPRNMGTDRLYLQTL
jgi:hypothetical protein